MVQTYIYNEWYNEHDNDEFQLGVLDGGHDEPAYLRKNKNSTNMQFITDNNVFFIDCKFCGD